MAEMFYVDNTGLPRKLGGEPLLPAGSTLLDLIKTVDGTGSGLDADLFRGLAPTAFTQRIPAALLTAIHAEGFIDSDNTALGLLLTGLPIGRYEGYISMIRDASNTLNIPPIGGNGVTGFLTIYKENAAYIKVRLMCEGNRSTASHVSEWEGFWMVLSAGKVGWNNTGSYLVPDGRGYTGWQPICWDTGWQNWVPQFKNNASNVLTGGTFSGSYRRVNNRVTGQAKWVCTTTLSISSPLTCVLPFLQRNINTGFRCIFVVNSVVKEGLAWTTADGIYFGARASDAVGNFTTFNASDYINLDFDYLMN
jgi:hypothetical protein